MTDSSVTSGDSPDHKPPRKPDTLESITELLEDEDSREMLMTVSAVMSMQQFSSPLPPPELLEAYGRLVRNAPERILVLTEQQAAHRRNMEQIVVKGDSDRAKIGLFLAFPMGLALLALAAYMTSQGETQTAGAMIILVMVGLVGVFVYGSVSRRAERRGKKERIRSPDTPGEQ